MIQNTLAAKIASIRCRKGKAHGISKKGAYWLPCDPVVIRRGGGDGVGFNAPDLTWKLEVRHYRSGQVTAVIRVLSWHQNNGDRIEWLGADILQATSGEDVIAILMAHPGGLVYCESREDDLLAWLAALGLPARHPSPDEGTPDNAPQATVEDALKWALDHLEDSMDPDVQAGVAAGRKLLS